MSIITWGQAWGLWDSQGGAHDKGAMMASVAEAESSLNTLAESYVGARGLWQEMPFWAGVFGWPVSYLFVATRNAYAAVHISGNGRNVGAWDTCYNPVSSAANRRNLSEPMVGSPAWNIWHRSSGNAIGGGVTATVSHGGASAAQRSLVQRVSWANHLQQHAIPDNTQWVKDDTKLLLGGKVPR